MTRRGGDHEDPHARFNAWLIEGPDGDLPRDVLVHAAYCDECRRAVAALDALALVDLGNAPMPATPQPSGVPARSPAPAFAARVLAAGGLAVAVTGAFVAGVGALSGVLGGPAETPVQQVLGGTGRPSPTLAPSPTPTPAASEASR